MEMVLDRRDKDSQRFIFSENMEYREVIHIFIRFDRHLIMKVQIDPLFDVFVMNFYSGDPAFMKIVSTTWSKIWTKLRRPPPQFMPMITVDNYDGVSLQENDTLQGIIQ
jgi:hypothetical protein